ncbi:hypothetical protein [Paracoccus sp. T5]|uniref:hypothetical protein n=1 Tax=Paracoccus sp. T5 TaxID=3402161 RepID=UPI003AD95C9F
MTHPHFTFVVLEKDHFVAQDMCAGLVDAAPGCQFLHLAVSDIPDDLLATLAGSSGLPVLVTKAQISEMDGCALVRDWTRNGWPIVLRLGIDPVEDIRARGWYSLAAPFTRDDLDDLVRRLTLGEKDRRLA